MNRETQRELLCGLLDYVDLCIARGRLHAAKEALDDAWRLDARMVDVDATDEQHTLPRTAL